MLNTNEDRTKKEARRPISDAMEGMWHPIDWLTGPLHNFVLPALHIIADRWVNRIHVCYIFGLAEKCQRKRNTDNWMCSALCYNPFNYIWLQWAMPPAAAAAHRSIGWGGTFHWCVPQASRIQLSHITCGYVVRAGLRDLLATTVAVCPRHEVCVVNVCAPERRQSRSYTSLKWRFHGMLYVT